MSAVVVTDVRRRPVDSVLIAVATGIWLKSRQAPITHKNVTHEWQGNLTAGIEKPQQQDSASAEPIAEPVREVTP